MKEPEANLHDIQKWMMKVLINPFPPGTSEMVEKNIRKGPRLSAYRHLQIYRQSYIARLRECMKKQFAVLAYTLGEELFVQFTNAYLSKYPSDNYSLNALGKQFAPYLQETRPDINANEKESWCDFMIELAFFEYALSELYDEKEPDNSMPIIKTFRHSFNIARYYLEFSHGKNPELYLPQTSFCAVKRDNYKLSIHELTEEEYLQIQNGVSNVITSEEKS